MEEEMMVAHAAFAGELRKTLAIRPEQKMSSPSREIAITERLVSACADLAHANTLVAHAASDVLDAFFELSRTRRVSFSTVTEDEHVETVVDALLDVARGADVSKVSFGRMTNKRARGGCDIATSLEHRRARGAARSANALRMALKRETHEKRTTRMRRNTSDGPRLENPARRAPPPAKTKRRGKTRPPSWTASPGGWTPSLAPRRLLLFGGRRRWPEEGIGVAAGGRESRAPTSATVSKYETNTPRLNATARPLASPIRERNPASAALELATQAFSHGDGANPKPPPAYYAHAAFVARDARYARKGRRAPKAFVSAAIRSGARGVLARADGNLDGPFPVTFVDVVA